MTRRLILYILQSLMVRCKTSNQTRLSFILFTININWILFGYLFIFYNLTFLKSCKNKNIFYTKENNIVKLFFEKHNISLMIYVLYLQNLLNGF